MKIYGLSMRRSFYSGVFLILPMMVMLGTFTPAFSQDEVGDVAYKLTVISKVSSSEKAKTEKRYRYVLQHFMELCSDVPKAIRAADMLIVVHRHISKTGLEEQMPALVETLHSMTQDIAPHAKQAKVPLKCSDAWAMYAILRQKGKRPDEARQGVTAVSKGLYRLVKPK